MSNRIKLLENELASLRGELRQLSSEEDSNDYWIDAIEMEMEEIEDELNYLKRGNGNVT